MYLDIDCGHTPEQYKNENEAPCQLHQVTFTCKSTGQVMRFTRDHFKKPIAYNYLIAAISSETSGINL
jgi:hypothetical protein